MREMTFKPDGQKLRVAIVASRFNDLLVRELVRGARETLLAGGVRDEDIVLVRVPGAFELPAAAQKLADTGQVHAIVVLGAILRGETYHFELIAQSCTQGVQRVAMNNKVGVGFGVLAVDTAEQGLARAGLKENRGAEAASTALEMARLLATV